jgi:protein-disulfide isomerase
MSFLKNSYFKKPSIVKPAIILALAIAVLSGIYIISSNKENNNSETKAEDGNSEKVEIVSTGLNKDEKIETIGDVEKVISKWVEVNPKAIVEAVSNMQRKMIEEQMKNAQQNISSKKDELFNNKNSAQHSPKGYNATIVEFFDYSCGYCKKAQAVLEEFIKQDQKVRIIYKEFPILGQASEEMSKVSIAVNIINPASYKKFHDALMQSSAHSKDEAIKIAESFGISATKIESTLKNENSKIEKIIQDNRILASSIGVNGTPGFIIGEELIPGITDVDSLKNKIQAVRSK